MKDDPLFMMQRGEFLDVGIMAGTNAEEGTNWEDLEFLVNATEREMRVREIIVIVCLGILIASLRVLFGFNVCIHSDVIRSA